jgi:hypothetical protein
MLALLPQNSSSAPQTLQKNMKKLKTIKTNEKPGQHFCCYYLKHLIPRTGKSLQNMKKTKWQQTL